MSHEHHGKQAMTHEAHQGHVHEMRVPLREVILATILTLPIVLGMLMPIHLGEWFGFDLWHALECVLAWVVVVWSGRFFHRGTWLGIQKGRVDMDALVTVGTGSALLWSTYAFLFRVGEVYFETAAVIVVFLLLGKWIEARQRERTGAAVQALLTLHPTVVHLMQGEKQHDVELQAVKKDEIFLVKSGERIPLDAVIVEGRSSVDESMLTGEAVPVEKHVGMKVFAGTLNQQGSFQARVIHVAGETMLDAIVETVKTAIAKKSPVERLVDYVSAIFVPTVIVIALITLVEWMVFGGVSFGEAIKHAVAVLIVACPCALGLATPAAVMVASGEAAKRGILIKDGAALEAAYKIKTVLFDKTGTLTQGKPEVTDVVARKGRSEEEILSLAAGLESSSEHPYATALLRAATERHVTIAHAQSFMTYPGEGVSGLVQGRETYVGNASFMQRLSIEMTDADLAQAEMWRRQAKTVLFVATGGELVGVMALQDRLKDDAAEGVRLLQTMGLQTALVTGDHETVAKEVAQAVGITSIFAQVKPQDKAKIVQNQQYGDVRVAFVGDGMNDAPALVQADLGMAMGSGSDIAKSAGQIVLLSSSVKRVAEALQMARVSFQTIKQNLFWAFIYNLVLIPLAAFGALNPILAGVAMALSSVSVLANSLRIKVRLRRIT